MGFDEQKFQQIFSKEKAVKHYTTQLAELKWQQYGLLFFEWNRGKKLMPEYTLKSAVEHVERENNMTILPAVIALVKGE